MGAREVLGAWRHELARHWRRAAGLAWPLDTLPVADRPSQGFLLGATCSKEKLRTSWSCL